MWTVENHWFKKSRLLRNENFLTMMMKDPFVNDNFSGGHSSEPNKEKNIDI